VLEACEFFTLHRLLGFPVVDDNRRIIGVVDVELYTTELSELDRSERNDYLFQLVGVHLAEAQQSAPLIAFRSRFPWLLCNIAGGILAAFWRHSLPGCSRPNYSVPWHWPCSFPLFLPWPRA